MARGQAAHVGDVRLDVGAEVGVSPQAPVDLHDHPLLNVLQLLITAKVVNQFYQSINFSEDDLT